MAEEGKLKDRDLMIMVFAFLAIIAFIAVLKYWDLSPKGLKFEGETCLKEINKKYVAPTSDSQTFYKIDKIEGDMYHLQAFRNGIWTFIGPKPIAYFKEGETFKFENATCPDVVEFKSTPKKTQYNDFQFTPKKK